MPAPPQGTEREPTSGPCDYCARSWFTHGVGSPRPAEGLTIKERVLLFGLYMFSTDYSIGPVEVGRAAEDHGFESLFLTEHTHIPASRVTPWPWGPELPREYSHTYDPFVALSMVAATTTTLKVGTGVCLVVERDPITTAKEVATLDALSGGRLLFGVGAGWNEEEMRNHGTDPATRFALLGDRVRAMREIWTQPEAEYHGREVDFDPLWSWPKPTQQPHPPVLIGGNGPRALERVLDFGDEWLPMAGRDPDALARRIEELQRLAGERGRGPIPVTVFGAAPDPDAIARYAEMGVHRCLMKLPAADADQVLPLISSYADVAMSFA